MNATRFSQALGSVGPPVNLRLQLLLSILLVLVPLNARAQQTAAFLKVGVGARALGMGGAYTAVVNDVNALAWNPAGLSSLGKREFGATHAELTADTRYDYLGYAQPTRLGTFGAAASYLTQGALEGRDDAGHPSGGFRAADSAVSLGFASKLDAGLRVGANLKYIQSTLASYSAQTYAVDLGAQADLGLRGPGVPIVGLAVQNLGPGMKFLERTEALPLTFAVGLGYRLPVGLTAALDFKHRPYEHDSEVDVGTEYALFSNFTLRAGYSKAAGSQALTSAGGVSAFSALTGVAAGFGLRAFGYSFDYSMTPFGELGNVQRFSLGARW